MLGLSGAPFSLHGLKLFWVCTSGGLVDLPLRNCLLPGAEFKMFAQSTPNVGSHLHKRCVAGRHVFRAGLSARCVLSDCQLPIKEQHVDN